jgi:predicted transcriptional regulator
MSLDISPEIEARIITKAQESGLSIDDYLEQVVGENEQFEIAVRKLEASAEPLSPEDAKAKIDRGLAQLERGEYVDGERFMTELLSDIDNAERTRRTG